MSSSPKQTTSSPPSSPPPPSQKPKPKPKPKSTAGGDLAPFSAPAPLLPTKQPAAPKKKAAPKPSTSTTTTSKKRARSTNNEPEPAPQPKRTKKKSAVELAWDAEQERKKARQRFSALKRETGREMPAATGKAREKWLDGEARAWEGLGYLRLGVGVEVEVQGGKGGAAGDLEEQNVQDREGDEGVEGEDGGFVGGCGVLGCRGGVCDERLGVAGASLEGEVRLVGGGEEEVVLLSGVVVRRSDWASLRMKI